MIAGSPLTPDDTIDLTNTSLTVPNVQDGVWYFLLKGQNSVGLWSTVSCYVFNIDTTGPAFGASTPTNWATTTRVTCTIGISDAPTGLNTSSIQYCFSVGTGTGNGSSWSDWNDASWIGGTARANNVDFEHESAYHRIKWRAADNLGNWNEFTQLVKVDTTSAVFSEPQPQGWTTTTNPVCSIRIKDLLSGPDLDTLYFRIFINEWSGWFDQSSLDNFTWLEPGKEGVAYVTIDFDTDGDTYQIKWKIKNGAGEEETISMNVMIDTTVPTITLISPVNGSIHQSGMTIDLSLTDLNGLDQVLYHWDSGVNITLPSPYDLLLPAGDSAHVLHIYGVDIAGNWAYECFVFITDDTAPLITLNSPMNNTVQEPYTLIDLNISDLNGLNQALYHWDSSANASLDSPHDVFLPSGDGQHVLHIYAEDAIGNWAYKRFVFTTDDTAPTITLNNPVNNTVHPSGTLADLSITDTTGVNQVLYHWDGASNTSLPSPYDVFLPSGDGQHVLHIYAEDTFGNWAVKIFIFITDDTIPAIILTSPMNATTHSSGTTIDLAISDVNGVMQVLYHWDSAANDSLSNPYDVFLPAGDEQHVLYVYVEDIAGNWAHKQFVFTTDDTAPTITLTSPANNTVHPSGTLIDVSIIDTTGVSQVLYHWDGASNTSLTSPYDVYLPSGDGQHVLHIFAEDTIGNWAYTTFVFTTYDAGPIITLTSPANNTVHPSASYIDLWMSNAHGVSQVVYNWDGGFNLTLSSPYDVFLPSGDGQHVLYVYARNTLGNWATRRFVFITDDTIPAITLNSPGNMTTHQSGTTIDLSIVDLNGVIQVLYHWDTAVNTSFNSPYDVVLPSDDGQHVLHVYAEDIAGNWDSRKFVFTTDDTSPTIILTSPVNDTVHESGALIDLAVSDAHGINQVRYHWDGAANTTLSSPYYVFLPSDDGQHVLHVYAEDTIGNWVSQTFVFITDDTSPVFTNIPDDWYTSDYNNVFCTINIEVGGNIPTARLFFGKSFVARREFSCVLIVRNYPQRS